MNYFKGIILDTIEITKVFIVERRQRIERRKRQSMMLSYYTRRLIERRKNRLDLQV
ncbi:conserved protein of unknown function [Shewanella benthica]|uniref:Uncharacterized protein n=1 Tax=Shewanella benthica TaxID=43661 RepID=A0A330M620_9GAMM|nr:conserved protein of unknown function [Shewanella benthica]